MTWGGPSKCVFSLLYCMMLLCGPAGMTAYASIKKIAEPKAGEVAFVSGAAGAVGLVAGQLLKHIYGCKVIGSAGTDDKVRQQGALCMSCSALGMHRSRR